MTMKKLIKIAVGLFLTLLLLLVAAIIIIPMVFDPNDYKEQIAAAVKTKTGRDLLIPGEIKLSVFPWLGVETGEIQLNNAPAFGDEPFLKIGHVAVKVRLWPLLSRTVEADTVILSDLYLNLHRDQKGRTNWEDLLAKEPPAEPKPVPAKGLALAAVSASIGGVRVENASAIWTDDAKNTRYDISKLSLHTGVLRLNEPVDLTLGFDLLSKTPALAGHIDLSARTEFDQAAQKMVLRDIKFDSRLRGAALPAQEMDTALSANAELDLASRHYVINGLGVNTELRGDNFPGKRLTARLSANLDLDLKAETLAVDQLELDALGLKASGKLSGRALLQEPVFSGTLTTSDINLRDLLARLEMEIPETADAAVLTKAAAQLKFNASSKHFTAEKLDLDLDQTHVQGNASIRNFKQPAISFNFAADKLDADRYLPPAKKEQVPAPAAAAAGAATLPLETLRKLNLDGSFTLASLKVSNLRFSDLALTVRAKDGVIRAHPVAASMYGGSYKGDLQLDARDETPVISMDEKLSGVEIGPLTQDYLQRDLASGTGNVQLKLTSKGISPAEARKTLNGQASIAFTNGGVKGFNLLQLIKEDYAKYASKLFSESSQLDQTVFSSFSASSNITNGLISTQDLRLQSAQLNVTGKGTADLVTQGLDLRLEVTPSGQLAKELGDFKGIIIPVKVQGTFTAPAVKTELEQALKGVAKARLEEEKARLEAEVRAKAEAEKAKLKEQLETQKKQTEEKAKEKIEEQLKDKLKGILR